MTADRPPSLAFPPHEASPPPDGSVYVNSNGNRIRKIARDGTISTYAGGGGQSLSDGALATDVSFGMGDDLTLMADGSLLLLGEHRILRIDPTGRIRFFAGTGGGGFSGDGGPAVNAQLNGPSGVAVARDGSVYIADATNNRVRKVAPDGIITTVVGKGGFCHDNFSEISCFDGQ